MMYFKRDAEEILKRYSNKYPVVTITGPRQSGKTTICQKVFPGKTYVTLEDLDLRSYAEEDPRGFLMDYSGGVIIDEIQRVPDLLSYIQGIVDKNQKKGEFILTGSSQFELSNKINQSLAGRTALLKLFPFSYREIYKLKKNSREVLNKIMFTGFYPRIFKDQLDPSDYFSAYIETYVERDVRQFSEIKDLKLFRIFLKLCAARTGQLLNYTSLSNDCGVSIPTIKNWISILEQSYLIFLLQPYYKNIKKRLIKTPKMYFYDVGLCAYLNGLKSFEFMDSLPNRGALFENFIIADKIKSNTHNKLKRDFYFFRNKNGIEVDLLIQDGLKLIPCEIKSSHTYNNSYKKNLRYYNRLQAENFLGKIIYAGINQTRQDLQIQNYQDFLIDL